MTKIHQDTNLYYSVVAILLLEGHDRSPDLLVSFAEEFGWDVNCLCKDVVLILNRDKGYNHYCEVNSENCLEIGVINNGL